MKTNENGEPILEVGDKIRIKNTFNDFIVTISRVTKTKAIAKFNNSYELSFKIKLDKSLGEYTVRPFSNTRWDTTTRKLIL